VTSAGDKYKTSLGVQEILGDERRPHEPSWLMTARGEQDMAHFVCEDPSQRSPNVRRAETRATQQASELHVAVDACILLLGRGHREARRRTTGPL